MSVDSLLRPWFTPDSEPGDDPHGDERNADATTLAIEVPTHVIEAIHTVLANAVYRPIDRSTIDDQDHADLAEILLQERSIDWAALEQFVPVIAESLDGPEHSILHFTQIARDFLAQR